MIRVLIMEDNVSLAQHWKQTFELNADYQVVICHNAKEALGFLDGEQYDLVITDLFVPGSSGGLGVLLKIFKMGQDRPLAIAVTGEKVPSVMSDVKNVYLAQAARLGAAITLEKPFPAAELIIAAQGLLED